MSETYRTSSWNSSLRGGEHFPDPFFDAASTAMPRDHRNVLRWAEFIWSSNGTYRSAMERVLSYFLTEVEIDSPTGEKVGDDERDKYKDFLCNDLDIITTLQSILRDRMCFHGDVKAVTQDGVFKLRDLAGKTVDVLSQDGVYRPAEFKTFGRQELLEVEFSDGRTVLATPEHEWLVKNCSGKEVVLPTAKLCRRHRIKRTVAPRPARNEEFREGVRHGFTFGDGTGYGDGRHSSVMFFGSKDAAIMPYFAGVGNKPRPREDRNAVEITGLPGHYKRLPDNTAAASYWYGFVCGFLAADGSVDTHGCAILTQKAKATLDAIAEQLPRIGMTCGPIRGHWREATFLRDDGSQDTYAGHMHYVTLLKRFMQAEDFLIPSHRENFEQHFDPESSYGEYIEIKDVRKTGIVDEVFCCVEMETHTFVVDQAVLTKNCYGNAFVSVLTQFRRIMICPKCGIRHPLKEFHDNPRFGFRWSNYEFHGKCQNESCRFSGVWKFDDIEDRTEGGLKIKRWNPHEIELIHDPFTDECGYVWRIPEYYKRELRAGSLFVLERASKAVIEAVKKNWLFLFAPDQMFHMKEPTLGGLQNRGWGVPRTLVNFRQIWYVQVLRRYNEAIALDYIIPFRVITPAPRGAGGQGGQDPLLTMNMGDFSSQVRRMLSKRRRDPASWHTLPFPINYQALGGEATALAPKDLLDQGQQTLLNEASVPAELWSGSLSVQAAPVAMRLHEATWFHLVSDGDRFLNWLASQLSQRLNWEVVRAKLRRVIYSDDVQRQQLALQLALSQQISMSSALKGMNFDYKEEQRRIADDTRVAAEIQSDVQEEMDTVAMGQQIAKGQPGGAGAAQAGAPQGGAPQGGDPSQMGMPGPVSQMLSGPGVPQTPQDMMAQADELAQQLLGMPSGTRRSEIAALKQKNETLGTLVQAKMDRIRADARSQGGQAAMQQQFGPQSAQ